MPIWWRTSAEEPRSWRRSAGAFTRVLEEIVGSPAPARIDPSLVRVATDGEGTFRIVDGIEDAAERVAWEAKTFRQLGVL